MTDTKVSESYTETWFEIETSFVDSDDWYSTSPSHDSLATAQAKVASRAWGDYRTRIVEVTLTKRPV